MLKENGPNIDPCGMLILEIAHVSYSMYWSLSSVYIMSKTTIYRLTTCQKGVYLYVVTCRCQSFFNNRFTT